MKTNPTVWHGKNFFETFYSPQNASLVIGGNFEADEVKILVEKYFGEIENNTTVPRINVSPPVLDETKKIIHEDNVQLPRLYLAWISDKLFGPDDAALDILSDILTGTKNSRIYKSLLFDKQIAQDVNSFQYSAKLNGSFIITSTPKPDVELHTIREEIFKQIKEIIENGITQEELQRSVNSFKSSYIYSLQNLNNLVDQINTYNCYLNEPNSFLFDIGRYESVTCEQVVAVAEKYLNKDFVELNVVPKK